MVVSSPVFWSAKHTHSLVRIPVVSIRSFLDHRSDVALLSARSKSLTEYRYLRLMLFSSLDVLFLLPISFYLLYIQSEQLMYPWNGLADLHYGFSAVGQVPFEVWRSTRSRRSVVLALPCTSIAACFVFFAFFGLAKESRDHYYSAWRAVSKIFTRSTADQASQFSEGSVICIFLRKPQLTRKYLQLRRWLSRPSSGHLAIFCEASRQLAPQTRLALLYTTNLGHHRGPHSPRRQEPLGDGHVPTPHTSSSAT